MGELETSSAEETTKGEYVDKQEDGMETTTTAEESSEVETAPDGAQTLGLEVEVPFLSHFVVGIVLCNCWCFGCVWKVQSIVGIAQNCLLLEFVLMELEQLLSLYH